MRKNSTNVYFSCFYDTGNSFFYWNLWRYRKVCFMENFIKNAVYDDYDRLVQLCDVLVLPTGFYILEKRFVDITIRYGVYSYTVTRWKKILVVKADFEVKKTVFYLWPAAWSNKKQFEIEVETSYELWYKNGCCWYWWYVCSFWLHIWYSTVPTYLIPYIWLATITLRNTILPAFR